MTTQVLAKNQVLPPANGKKLWRVKRQASETQDRSAECLNNSLKISAAGAKFTVKRPPGRRPKNRPGKPKDFVFVDLSPIKSAAAAAAPKAAPQPAVAEAQLATPQVDVAPMVSPLDYHHPTLNYDLGVQQQPSSDEESLFSLGYEFQSSSPVSQASTTGDDLMGLGIQWEQQPQDTYQQLLDAQQTMMAQYQQIQMLQEQLKQQQQHRRQSAPQPRVSKPVGPRRVCSVPAVPSQPTSYELDDFMVLNDQFEGLDTSFDFHF
ncbi:hypothetical protein DIURU_001196 [Diutina rugosa]|uniref:Uncharacterized protein n=1 Tax=Diutina rugosa TaxID=5481 RepID=A0A642V213_DIURU|nr:uncharacterized protein DIURU_001196 [Diutina rugosa]KAA8906254.1 hypothetical protein DIURU_001196 [Diutina rugosa]